MKNQNSKKFIVGNWKMNPDSLEEAKKLADDIRKKIKVKKSIAIFCPPALFLKDIKGKKNPKIKYGLQNVFYEKNGPFTGEISALMAKNLDVDYVIVGHSERRSMGETDEMISRKMSAVIRSNMTPILCVGEKKVDEHAEHLEFIRDQLVIGLSSVGSDDITKVIVAYEPVYAIGAKQAVGIHQIHQRNIFIKKILSEIYGKQKAFSVPILYGGTVNVDNAKEIVKESAVDGLLIGRQSLIAKDFAEIVNRVDKI